jgi:predicted neutral ceramidase superfamily lipid hydrolase
MDRLNYAESINLDIDNLTLLIQNMYTSTWWALIISMINLISIFTITSIVYKKNYLHFISILIWIILFILSIDLTKNISYNISSLAIFLPIILLNIKAYFNQKNITSK